MTPEQGLSILLSDLTIDPAWRPSFESVPRHLFVPDTIWQLDRSAGGRLTPLRRSEEPDRWLRYVYSDEAVETQVDDGHPAEDGSGWEVTSSSSQPSVVAEMLRTLNLEPGMRVLEIGTGTGWNAALLADRVGAENVTTIEIDTQVAVRARAMLDRAGFEKVTTIVGDGSDGWVSGAPYDRLIATAGATTVPAVWLGQTITGGRFVVPMNNTFQSLGIVTFDVAGDGSSATGRIGGPATFMGLRSQRTPRVQGKLGSRPDVVEFTDLHPYRWAGNRAVATAIGIRLGDGIHMHYAPVTEETGVVWLRDPDSGSWATVDTRGGSPYDVEQAGLRRLMDEVGAAYRWWLDAGSPQLADWTVTVTAAGQTIGIGPPAA